MSIYQGWCPETKKQTVYESNVLYQEYWNLLYRNGKGEDISDAEIEKALVKADSQAEKEKNMLPKELIELSDKSILASKNVVKMCHAYREGRCSRKKIDFLVEKMNSAAKEFETAYAEYKKREVCR
jgi:hypothetical protein